MLSGLRRLLGGDDLPALERALIEIANRVWEVETNTRGQHYPQFEFLIGQGEAEREQAEADRERRLARSFDQLLARWSEPELTRLAADMYFDSRAWYDRYAWDHRRPEATRWLLSGQGRIITYVLHRWIAAHPPTDLVGRLRRRIEELLLDPYAGPPTPYGRNNPYPPTLRACLELLQGLAGEEATTLAYDLIRGAIPPGPQPPGQPGIDPAHRANGYEVFLGDLDRAAPWLLERVWRAGLLTEELLERIFRWELHLLGRITGGPTASGRRSAFHATLPPELADLIEACTWRIVRRWAEHLDSTNARSLSEVSRLEGSWYLLRACEYVERLGLKRLPPNYYGHRGEVAAAVTRLCHVARPGAGGEDDAAVVQALRAFKESTLLLVLPAARAYQSLICQALGWDGADELIQLVQRIAHLDTTENTLDLDVRNSADPTNGVFDAREARDAYARLGPKRFASLARTFADYPSNTKNAFYLVEAAIGLDQRQQKVVAGFAKRNQVAVRALGLLPFEHPDEVLRRYVALRQFAREAGQFGMQRQTNERAAALAGLANLALNAGYPDATRLEWAMEDRLGAGLGAAGRMWLIDDRHAVRLEVGAGGVELTAWKDGKALRGLPAVVKQHPDYPAMKEAVAELRAQARRYRAALEDAMCRGEALAPGEIATLARNPAAAGMLAGLLVVDATGAIGLLCPADGEIEDVGGARRAVAGPVRIAHPFDLHECGLLAAWQREIVRRRIVQPFKQAFRELYVVTPAEQETRVFSRRFAGQVVSSARASRLLQSEAWECAGEDYPRKVFHHAGIVANLTFAEYYHYISEIESLVVDEVYFLPARGPRWWRGAADDPRLPLAEVPPIVFSEVMRDVDLVVSVAQYAGPTGRDGEAGARVDGAILAEARCSSEVVERRADLVRDLAADLGFRNVTVAGQYAHVKGKLASYRVHLGSAAIHIEPGAYLCVVPANWGQKHARLFLPFDGEDLKTSEVISKVLLLAEDDKIKDESILAQIRARR